MIGTVAHFYPGMGNVMDLPVDFFFELRREIPNVMRLASGKPMSNREIVDKQMEG